jgi:hypothetical protein
MPRSSKQLIAAERSDHQYFVIVPHLVLALCRDPYEYTLWSVVKTLAGDGECTLSARDLARLCGCGVGKVCLARDYLIECGLLLGEIRPDPDTNQATWRLAVPDLWPENNTWRATVGHGRKPFIAAIERTRAAQRCSPDARGCSPGEHLEAENAQRCSPDARGCSPDARGCSPGEHLTRDASLELRGKEVKRINDIPITELWERVKNQLRLQMTRSTYETWIHDTQAIDYAADALMIGVANAYAQDWLSLRLRPLIERNLASVAGAAIAVTFIIAKPEEPHGAETDL